MKSNTKAELIYKAQLYFEILKNIIFKVIEKIIKAKQMEKKKRRKKYDDPQLYYSLSHI